MSGYTKGMETTSSKQIRVAQGILWALAVLAILAGVASISDLSEATAETKVVETWRMLGFFAFAGIFGILAQKPKLSRGLWSVVILNKLALTVAGLIYLGNYRGATDLVVFDGTITILLIVAYALSRPAARP